MQSIELTQKVYAGIGKTGTAVLAFLGLMLLFFSQSYSPANNAPTWISYVLLALSIATIFVKYELNQIVIPHLQPSGIVSIGIMIGNLVIAYFAKTYGAFWWWGLLIAIVTAAIWAYSDMTGQIPTPPQATVTNPS